MENTMTIKEYYDEIVKLTEEYLEQYEFKRSGTTSVFYRYNDNKTKGWIIGFRKSLDNTSDWCRFVTKFGCLETKDLASYGISHDRVRLKELKMYFMDGYSMCDYIHDLDWLVVGIESVDIYFKNRILPELEKIIKQFQLQ